MRELQESVETIEQLPDRGGSSSSQLSDSSRVRIFWLLCHCEECVIDLSAMVGMSSPAVSHHLRQLRESGLHRLAAAWGRRSTTARRTASRRSYCTA